MTLKILGGIGQNLSLRVLDDEGLRPTSVLLRRRLFDAYQNLEDRDFIDGCAGSGAIGIEAWSRGAKRLWLIEFNKNAFPLLKENSELVRKKFADEVEARPIFLLRLDILTFCKDESKTEFSDPIFFLDPPYEDHHTYLKVLELLYNWRVKPLLILEGCRQKGKKIDFWKDYFIGKESTVVKIYEQGTSYLMVVSL